MRNLLGIVRISRLPSSPFFSRDLATSSNLNKSHYEILGVPSSASKKEIRDAYIEKSKLCHPDHDPLDSTLHVKFLAVQEAYDILSTDTKRKEYDFGSNNFRQNLAHPRSSVQYPNRQAPGWSQQQQQQQQKYDKKKENRVVVGLLCLVILLGIPLTLNTYRGRQAEWLDRQKRLSERKKMIDDERIKWVNFEARILRRKISEENTKGD